MSWFPCNFCIADLEKYDQNSKNGIVEVCFACCRCARDSRPRAFFIKFLLTSDFLVVVVSVFGPFICYRHPHGGFSLLDRAIWLGAVELRSSSLWCDLYRAEWLSGGMRDARQLFTCRVYSKSVFVIIGFQLSTVPEARHVTRRTTHPHTHRVTDA